MIQRAVLLTVTTTALVLAPLGGACSSNSSSLSTDAGAEATSGSSPSSSSAGVRAGGLRDSIGASGSSSGGPEDSGGDVRVSEDGATGSGPESGTTDGPSAEAESGGPAPEASSDEAAAEAESDEASMDAESHEASEETGGSEAGTEGGEAGQEAEAGAGCVNLTVENVEVWCAVSINGATASIADEQIVCVPPGIQHLAATALVFFELGPAPWHDTAGDTGQGDPGTLTGSGQSAVDSTTVAVGDTAKCVWICCPFPDGTGCPTNDQCP
jgi:hypothetical protein